MDEKTMNNQLDQFVNAYTEDFKYAFDNNIMLDWYPRRILELCSSKGKLLELGLGHGLTTSRFSRYFEKHVVIDASSSVIEQFKVRYPDCNAEIIKCYFEDFHSDELFDVIVMGFVLEHVEDPNLLLRHFKKFLAPEGRFFITVPNAESLHRRLGYTAGLLNDLMELGAGDLELGHRRLYSLSSLEDSLFQNNYRVVRKEGIFLKPFTTHQLRSLDLDKSIIKAMCTVGIDYPELSCALLVEVENINK